MRWGAVRALGRIGDARSLEPLARATHDEDAIVREAAERAMRGM